MTTLRPYLIASLAALPLASAVPVTAGGAQPAPAASAPAAAPAAATPSPEVAKARAAIMGLGDKLRGALMGAMTAGGPAAAVETCKTAAPQLSQDASKPAEGLIVARTALRVRNPKNAPDAFEKKVLEDFAAKARGGADVTKLEHVEEIEQNGVKLVRYMKAIPMAETPCSACHGATEKLDPAAAAKVKELYPADQATGFAPGDVRGAFTVTMKK